MSSSLVVALAALVAASPVASESIPYDAPVQLGLSLALTHRAELDAFRRAQQDPRSPDFRHWLTPAEFGERFGQPPAVYAAISAELAHAGLEVTSFPSRAFLIATGSAAQVERLLGAQLAPVAGEPVSVHALIGELTLPASFGPVINISGLDTRPRFHHRISIGGGMNALGPQDLRRFYGLDALHNQGYVGQGQKLAVLSTALQPGQGVSVVGIQYFFTNISNVQTPFLQRVIPNPGNDFDRQPGGASEYELDVEMQSVGVPGADSITLVVSPSSTVFTVGANDIVNNLPTLTAVSVSLGICELAEQQQNAAEVTALRNAIIQGTTEGQTWSAASGDNGANDCQQGGSPTVDFPSSIPEFVAAGGTSIPGPAFDLAHALGGYQQEVTWNDGAQGGAAGGGISAVFMRPAYQQGLNLPGTGRSVPDLSLISGGPGVAVSSSDPPGPLDPAEGTSVASPLSAGFFALIASRVGCRLGDVHAALYALGAAQFDGGAAVFHDVTSGNLSTGGVTGPSAAVGYDSATGWGSLDVAAIAAAWPPCPALPDGGSGTADAGLLVAYTACGFLNNCDGGTCTSLPGGPSTCEQLCNTSAPSCPPANICSQNTVFSSGTTGACVPGCSSNADCASTPGNVCSLCDQVCVPPGSATAKVGDPCTSSAQCPSGAYCTGGFTFANGYCTYDCIPNSSAGSACSCPAASHCGAIGPSFNASNVCLATCPTIGASCGRSGYVCQQQTGGPASCLPNCRVLSFNGQMFDTCSFMGSSLKCDTTSGICGGPRDAGTPDAGQMIDAGVDAGMIVPDAGPGPINVPLVPTDLGAPISGCGCNAGGAPFVFAAVLALVRRRRARS